QMSHTPYGAGLQVFGLGMIMPLAGHMIHHPQPTPINWLVLFALLPTQLACAVSTALPDQHADRAVGKRTFVVHFGASQAIRWIIGLQIVSTFASGVIGYWVQMLSWKVTVLSAGVFASIQVFGYRFKQKHRNNVFVFLQLTHTLLLLLAWSIGGYQLTALHR
ncbi:MAG: UbiA family prenyltransferase, partial [Myxococcota bacterium]